MGGVVGILGRGMASSLRELEAEKSAAIRYRGLAAEKEQQAAYVASSAQHQNEYLLRSANEKANEVYQKYRQQAASQQAAMAASGLRGDSYTVQHLLKNNRFQALLDESAIQAHLQTDVYENNLSAAQQVRTLKTAAQQYRRSAGKSNFGWKLGISLLDLFSAR
ncbi:MAG: hypothetical protein IKP06_06005 [Elusimicrobiaceae bacterium]|nr:hypothetical protein [Elusimicrobiaceae bacterium]